MMVMDIAGLMLAGVQSRRRGGGDKTLLRLESGWPRRPININMPDDLAKAARLLQSI
ncbi:hypothetical protein LB517_12265 [Mesorhizobium sp. BR1-1-12]|nr:hypothetical protein [Mesorhizobium sp. BR1-1-7]MBZ9953787.1 hypothetical protein [Mesorhizobium sp. BR1-1-15]MBZ9970409.1 hypothetical protein [Mesorhizobium sp. BR1-1-12]